MRCAATGASPRPIAVRREPANPLVIRELEQRRVLTVSPGAVIVAPVVLAGLGEGEALSLEPGEGAGTDASAAPTAQQQSDPVPTTPANENQQDNDSSPASSEVSMQLDDPTSIAPAANVAANQLDSLNVEAEAQALSIAAASDQSVNEGAALTITDIGTFSDPTGGQAAGEVVPLAGPYTFTINWGDGTAHGFRRSHD